MWAVSDDVVGQLLSKNRWRKATKAIGQAMTGNAGHEVAGLESLAGCGVGHGNDHAVHLPERDDRAVGRSVQSHRNADQAQQHKYHSYCRGRPVSEVQKPCPM